MLKETDNLVMCDVHVHVGTGHKFSIQSGSAEE